MFKLNQCVPILLAIASFIFTGCQTTPTTKQVLFNGENLAGWKQPTGKWMVAKAVSLQKNDPHLFAIEPGTGIFLNGQTGKVPNLIGETGHGDCEAHIEFCVSSNSNSGVYFQGRYEVQILDSWGKKEPSSSDCGGIYQRWKDDKGFEGHAPLANASKRPGDWQSFDVVFRAPRFDVNGRKVENARFVKIFHNGKLIHQNVEVTGPTRSSAFNDEKANGPLMLQGDHGPVAFRNLWLKPRELK